MLSSWKENYDNSRYHIKGYITLPTKLYIALYSQSYDFSISHVQMWELDHKDGCCCSLINLCLFDSMNFSTPGFHVLHYLLEFAQTHVHRVDDATQPSHPQSLPSSLAPNLSQHWGLPVSQPFTSDGQYNAVQGTLKSFLQHHHSERSILQHSVFFMVQLSHLYMTIGKTTALTRWTFVGKVMSPLFNMLSRFVIDKYLNPRKLWFTISVT